MSRATRWHPLSRALSSRSKQGSLVGVLCGTCTHKGSRPHSASVRRCQVVRLCVLPLLPVRLVVLQKVLAGMRDRGATAAVLEVDTEALATGSLAWVQPTISVFTNLGDDPCSMFSSKEVSSTQKQHPCASWLLPMLPPQRSPAGQVLLLKGHQPGGRQSLTAPCELVLIASCVHP